MKKIDNGLLNFEIKDGKLVKCTLNDKDRYFSPEDDGALLQIPAGVKVLGSNFIPEEELDLIYGGIHAISLPDGLVKIEEKAFSSFLGGHFLYLFVPKSVAVIEAFAFENCDGIKIYCETKKPLIGLPNGWAKSTKNYSEVLLGSLNKFKWNVNRDEFEKEMMSIEVE